MTSEGKKEKAPIMRLTQTMKSKEPFHCCLFCKSFSTGTNSCSDGTKIEDYRMKVCDDWRYCF